MSETWKKIAEAPDHDVYLSNLGKIAWVALTNETIVIEKAFDRYGRLIYDRHWPQLVKEKPNAAGE